MKIKYLIDTILTPKISVLDFVDRYAGIVRTINIAEGNGTETGIVKRYPVACNVTGADCANIGIYQNLVPDDTKKSIVYWEMIQPMSNVGYTSTRNFFEKRFRGTARLVVWLNLAKLGIENCTDAVNIIPILEKEITTRGKIMGGIFDGAQLRIQPLRMVNQEINTVFGKYDYNKLKNFYLYPFDFFAIDVQFTLEQCLDKGGTFPVLPAADCENQIPSEVVCKSLSFDGVNEYIDCTNNSAFSFNEGNAFSLETWVKFDNLTGFRFVISKWLRATPTDIRGYYFATNGNKLIFSFFSSNSTLIQAENTNILSIGQWYHLACTYDGSSDANGIKLYINNVENSTILVNSLSGVATNNIPLQIGGQDTFYTAGQIAKARVWNVELTASDVNTQYNGGTIQTSPVESGNLVVDTDINNAVFGTQFNIPDLTGITGGYTSVNMEDGDLLNECPDPSIVVCKSLVFDGVNEVLNCTNNAVFDFGIGNSYSIETWVKFNDLSGFRFIVSKWLTVLPADAQAYFIGTNGDKFTFRMFAGNTTGLIIDSNISLVVGQWYHLISTYDGSTNASGANLYINNVSDKNVIRDNLSGNIVNSEPLQIAGQSTFFASAQIAKVRVWNLELSAAEVATMYNSGTIQTSPVQSGNLVLDTDINNATYSTEFNVPDLTGITAGYTSVNMENTDLLNECPE